MYKKIASYFIKPSNANKCQNHQKKGFTLAEVLLTLSVIGILASIVLPSIIGDASEKAWETQRKAIYTRFSQVIPLIPSLNNFGTLTGTLGDGEDQTITEDTATLTFVQDGLGKYLRITNICSFTHGETTDNAVKLLAKCGLPNKITAIGGGSVNLSSMINLATYNNSFNKKITVGNASYEQLNTDAVAFETINGEKVLAFYNPNCQKDKGELNKSEKYFTQPKMCANFIYDLNGKKGPNMVGKDIGFITALYSKGAVVVSPIPYEKKPTTSIAYSAAFDSCEAIGPDLIVPNIDDITSMMYNKKLLGIPDDENRNYWSNTKKAATNSWAINTATLRRTPIQTSGYTWCVRRMFD